VISFFVSDAQTTTTTTLTDDITPDEGLPSPLGFTNRGWKS